MCLILASARATNSQQIPRCRFLNKDSVASSVPHIHPDNIINFIRHLIRSRVVDPAYSERFNYTFVDALNRLSHICYIYRMQQLACFKINISLPFCHFPTNTNIFVGSFDGHQNTTGHAPSPCSHCLILQFFKMAQPLLRELQHRQKNC